MYAFGRTPGTVMAQAAGLDGFADYKALVCVFLLGGNDSWSMLVPRSHAEYGAYAASRQNLAIAQDQLLPIEPLDRMAPHMVCIRRCPGYSHCSSLAAAP